MAEKIKILYIDDEMDNLTGFKATLRLDYQVFTAVNIPGAMEHLEKHPDIRVIFCDQRMPVTTGVEFFEGIRVSHPLPMRILNRLSTLLTAATSSGLLKSLGPRLT